MKEGLFKRLAFMTLLAISIYATSCKKDNVIQQFGASETPVAAITALPIYETPHLFSAGSSTMGLLFRSAKNGRITHLGARLSTGTYTVVLWDSTSTNTLSIIKSAHVTVTDSLQYAFADIDDVSITANKLYAITVNNTPDGASFYKKYWVYIIISPSDNLPRTVGDITFINEVDKLTTDPLSINPPGVGGTHPDNIVGLPEFKFEPQL